MWSHIKEGNSKIQGAKIAAHSFRSSFGVDSSFKEVQWYEGEKDDIDERPVRE